MRKMPKGGYETAEAIFDPSIKEMMPFLGIKKIIYQKTSEMKRRILFIPFSQ